MRVFEDGGARQMLRPDAEVVYDEGGQRLRMVIALDRSTCPLGDIADQLRRYHRESGKALVTVAYVTTKSDERARDIIAMANGVATTGSGDTTRIRVLATSLRRLTRRGLLERIWWRAGTTGHTALPRERPGTGAERAGWAGTSPGGDSRGEK